MGYLLKIIPKTGLVLIITAMIFTAYSVRLFVSKDNKTYIDTFIYWSVAVIVITWKDWKNI